MYRIILVVYRIKVSPIRSIYLDNDDVGTHSCTHTYTHTDELFNLVRLADDDDDDDDSPEKPKIIRE